MLFSFLLLGRPCVQDAKVTEKTAAQIKVQPNMVQTMRTFPHTDVESTKKQKNTIIGRTRTKK